MIASALSEELKKLFCSARTIFVYEPGQIQTLEALLPHRGTDAEIVAMDMEVEYLLQEKNIPFVSGRRYRETETLEHMKFTEQFIENLFKRKDWQWFSYRNIPLGRIFAFPLRQYLNRSLYYIEFFSNAASHQPAPWFVFRPNGPTPDLGGPLIKDTFNEVVNAAQCVAKERHVKIYVPPEIPPERRSLTIICRRVQRAVFNIGIELINMGMRLFRHRDATRLIISDTWSHVGSVVSALPEAEVIMIEKRTLFEIPFREMWRHRIRFNGLNSAKETHSRGAALKQLKIARQGQSRARTVYKAINISLLVENALDILAGSALATVVQQIDGAYDLLREPTTAVLLRVSTGGQTHYGVLALVAKQLGVPAIELQHGLEYLGEGSISRDHMAEYLALYGPIIHEEFVRIGYDPVRLINIGSPRFDTYRASPLDGQHTILCIVQDLQYVGEGPDSYDMEDFYVNFFSALPPDSEVVIKLRGKTRESFFRSLIARTSGTHLCQIERDTPLSFLFKKARVVVSCYSTAALESLQFGIPTILLAPASIELETGHQQFDRYVAAGAFTIVKNGKELGNALEVLSNSSVYEQRMLSTQDFMKKSFCFDGNAALRIRNFVRKCGN